LGRVSGKLSISEPKTDRSRRTVPITPPLVAMLKAHRADQAAERLAAGSQWTDVGLVFASEFGTPVDPRNILRTIQIAAEKAGMTGIGVHTLRHSAAVAWLEAGVHIKAVADLLGHSSISITGDIYGHTSDDTARAAVGAVRCARTVNSNGVAIPVDIHTPDRYEKAAPDFSETASYLLLRMSG
jgi:integrase